MMANFVTTPYFLFLVMRLVIGPLLTSPMKLWRYS